jgi:hypothetical protein
MATYSNAVPQVVFNGIRDRSRRPFIRPEITYAQHCPLLRLFTETGPTETTYVGDSDDGFASIFGADSLAPRSKYFNLQSLLALNLLGQGNGFYVKRLKPEDAGAPARLIMALEMVRDMIPVTVQQLSGFNYPDLVTDLTDSPVSTDATVEGYRARIVLIRDNTTEIGGQRVLPGEMISSIDNSQSSVYPLMELPASFFGKLGNNQGMRIWAPTRLDLEGYDEETAAQFLTRMYRVQFVEMPAVGTTPTIIKTANQEDFVNVSFDEGVFSNTNDLDYTIDEVLVDRYADDGVQAGLSPLYSPFSQVYVYRSNVQVVQELIFDAEMRVNPAISSQATEPTQIDFLTMLQEDGDPYQSVKLEGALGGGILLGKQTVVFAAGGKDGTMNLDTYANLVDIENLNFGKLGDQYDNIAIYQFGQLYDTGLPMESKFRAMNAMAARRDIQYFFTTMIEGEKRGLTVTEEASRTQALITRLKAFPESVLYGTGVCRAMIVLQSGKLMAGGYNKRVPQLLDVAMKWAKYAGAGTGQLNEAFKMDKSPNNRVSFVKGLNIEFIDARTRSQVWTNGATWSQSYDTRSQYYPCLRSVTADDTSVLLSPVTVNICCVLIRLIYKVHADFSGDASIDKNQLIERTDERILELTKDLFGDRVDIIPRTYISPIDENNGTSWSCRVTVAANNPHTTFNFDLETVRRENRDPAVPAVAGR